MNTSKFNFFLNHYKDYAFTKCPKCDRKTAVRKFCLVVHYEEKAINFYQLLILNKSCKFCAFCNLIIAKKSEMEFFIQDSLAKLGKEFNPENYFIFGTMDKKDWLNSNKEPVSAQFALNNLTYPFKNVLDFDIEQASWYFEKE